MSSKSAIRPWTIVAAAGLAIAIGVVAGQLWFGNGSQIASSGQSSSSGVATIGGPFTLIDHNGQSRSEADFNGRYMMVFFGYTHCPDFCPLGLQAMTESLDAVEEIAGADTAARIDPVFITVDPERDTAAVLKDYVTAFHPRLLALTGSPEQVGAAAKAYRVYYARAGEGEDYLMDHSTFTYLMGPDGNYVTHFRHGMPPRDVAERIIKAM